MTDLATFVSALAGFSLLLAAMRGNRAHRSAPWRLAGLCALMLALAFAVLGRGWGEGLVAWCGWLTLSSVAVTAANTLTAGPHRQARR